MELDGCDHRDFLVRFYRMVAYGSVSFSLDPTMRCDELRFDEDRLRCDELDDEAEQCLVAMSPGGQE